MIELIDTPLTNEVIEQPIENNEVIETPVDPIPIELVDPLPIEVVDPV